MFWKLVSIDYKDRIKKNIVNDNSLSQYDVHIIYWFSFRKKWMQIFNETFVLGFACHIIVILNI